MVVEKEDEANDEKKKKRESRGWAPEAGGKSINKRRSPATQLAASSHSLSFFWPDFFVLLFLLLDLLVPLSILPPCTPPPAGCARYSN